MLVEGLRVDLAVPLVDSLLLVVEELHVDLDFQLLLRVRLGLRQLLPLEDGCLGDF